MNLQQLHSKLGMQKGYYLIGYVQMGATTPNNVGSYKPKMLRHLHRAKSVTGFKLCTTTSNNMPRGVQTDATCNIQQCCIRLHAALVKRVKVYDRSTFCQK